MRLATMAYALAIVVCVAVFGAILSQKASVPISSKSPAQTVSTEGSARAVVTTLEERSAPPVEVPAAKVASRSDVTPGAPTVVAQVSPAVASAPVSAPAKFLPPQCLPRHQRNPPPL
jgi:hypothetical protein